MKFQDAYKSIGKIIKINNSSIILNGELIAVIYDYNYDTYLGICYIYPNLFVPLLKTNLLYLPIDINFIELQAKSDH